jgi:hypothetical protein
MTGVDMRINVFDERCFVATDLFGVGTVQRQPCVKVGRI